MSNLVIIENIDGTSVEIDADLFKQYQSEAFEYLREEAEQKSNFKEAVETIAETTKLDKKVLTKYFKTKFKEKTKEASALGEMFAALDQATEEILNVKES
jgi:hypothetical protein